jgi:type VI secretion system protein ImpM
MTGRPFLFGKLPAHGDFVARGLTADEQAAWDDWASAGLEAARAELGDAFEDAHDTAPSWRFIASDGGSWRLGALACSVDSAGRRFILVLGAADLSAAEALALGAPAAGALEGVLYEALAMRTKADDAVRAVGVALDAADETDRAAVGALAASPAAPGVWWTLGGERHPPQVVPAGPPPRDLLVQMLRSPSKLEMAT